MEDQRQEEFDCIAAIFPELVFENDNPFSATLDLPVHPTSPVKVVFPPSADGLRPTPPLSGQKSGQEARATTDGNAKDVESHNLTYLPSLRLRIVLPEGYPEEKPPQFDLSTNPAWLSRSHLDKLQETGTQMWEEAGRSPVVYGYIDSLQQLAENAFGFSEEGKILEIPRDLKISLLDFDLTAVQGAFDKQTFPCGVCLDPKKGAVCHRMVDCGHVFCVECLQDFYTNAIKEGDLVSIRCLTPGCAKEREEAQRAKGRKPKTHINPSELLQIPLELDVVTRYVKLKHKAALESDKNTIWCPRQWCQGAARSNQHRPPSKPAGLEDDEPDEDLEAQEPEPGPAENKKWTGMDLLSVCEDCSFAFCSRCLQGWHGELFRCYPPRNKNELSEEEQASLKYMKMYSTACPTCGSPAQKTHGCNHMICFKCNTHFCYLCASWLDAQNPYRHFNEDKTRCFGRLWELEHGDGEEAGYEHPPVIDGHDEGEEQEEEHVEEQIHAMAPVEAPIDIPEIEEPEEEEQPRHLLEREGPLVLRLNHVPRPAAPLAPAVPDPPPANRRHRGPQPRHQNQHQAHDVRRQPGRRNAQPAPQRVRPRHGVDQVVADPEEQRRQDAAHQAWVQMFVQMALNDQEDQVDWDSEDEEDGAAWEIPVR